MRKVQGSIWAGLLFLTMIPSVAVHAEETPEALVEPTSGAFGMDTQVVFGDEKEPAVRTTTVFQRRRAYDVVAGDGGLITRFDFREQSIALLDRRRGLHANIAFGDILRFQVQLHTLAQKRQGSFLAFLADPTFIREFDASNSTISLSSPWLSYEAKGAQSASDVVEQFVEFADWSARLASMLNANAPPAKARLVLNEAIKKQNWQVSRVTRTGGPRARTLGVVRSEHKYRDVISENDRLLIEAVEKDLKSFKEISFSEFSALQNSPRVATKK